MWVQRRRLIARGAALVGFAVVCIGLTACNGPSHCSPYPQCLPSLSLQITSSDVFVKPGASLTFTADASNLASCGARYSWDFEGNGMFNDATGSAVTKMFAAAGHRVVEARVADCRGSATAGTNIWVSASSPPKCPAGRPFDLLSGGTDANNLPLNPEWLWQCDYAGFVPGAAYPAAYPDPSALCNGFSWTSGHRLDPGTNCSSQIQGPDSPGDALWYTICHFTPNFPYEEPDKTVHGHVNWSPVAFEGTVRLQRIQQDFPFGDGDVDLNLFPTPTHAQQNYTHTPPGVTWENPASIHIEFGYDEVVQPLPASTGPKTNIWAAALAGLGGPSHDPVRAIVVGLWGLDARHGSYSEVHPIYAMALQETSSAQSSRWLILARNFGGEGGCSTKANHHFVPPEGRVTMTLPVTSQIPQAPTANSYYVASFTDKPDVAVTPTGSSVNLTVQLPPAGQNGVVIGELELASATAAQAPAPRRRFLSVAPTFPASLPTTPQDPEDFLAMLAPLAPAPQQRRALAVPLAPRARQPMTAAEACALLRGRAHSLQAAGQDSAEVHLVQQICTAAKQPF